ncbi:2-dehydro-3-deoxygluconokinase [Chryseobacterium bernardetii]|uniref:2-dehydro-3-deoxygluconokinase n=3 Tax=Chryseobacterium TaxID=59732 RepID=A0A543EJC9_9FLAO|nr:MULTISPECIES: sugar kinase [Chryseobacterium]MDR6370135.1 2-dehydro-3-deoxygluconokinase [Chryseobacterium vietnamense]MDR6440622.1 2-dehydro-3-deoxygluconokinase [Chryseobacterium bernardetii]MDR6458168.1 2-dehydro-3-deoxygluconokinase [Chryseobacterium vietnamense]TQM21695.1 2-dehydro-3-deoxygluconokinase [Chryseobacterium aquifrigidense]
MSKIVTFGEVIMRLSPPGNRTMKQSHEMEFFFGGTELNVAASLATMGCEVQHVSCVSDDFVGESAVSFIQGFGIDTTFIDKNEHPLGLYFLEVGSSVRASRIAYNRLNGSFANIRTEKIDWKKVLEGCEYFHWTGISPGISESAYEALKEGLKTAQHIGIEVTADPAYRSNLWKYGKNGSEVLKELVSYSTIFIGGVNEINEILGTRFSSDKEGFIEACKELKQQIPSVHKIFDKIRIGVTASSQQTQGRAWVNENYFETDLLEINPVVDRIGTGDAFAAGLIYGLKNFDDEKALNFANAACAIKHTIPGDISYSSVEDILEVMNGNSGGRIKR